jgi:hypothetical protein
MCLSLLISPLLCLYWRSNLVVKDCQHLAMCPVAPGRPCGLHVQWCTFDLLQLALCANGPKMTGRTAYRPDVATPRQIMRQWLSTSTWPDMQTHHQMLCRHRVRSTPQRSPSKFLITGCGRSNVTWRSPSVWSFSACHATPLHPRHCVSICHQWSNAASACQVTSYCQRSVTWPRLHPL